MPTDTARMLVAVSLARTISRATGELPYRAASFAPLFSLDRDRVAELATRAETACRKARAALAAERDAAKAGAAADA